MLEEGHLDQKPKMSSTKGKTTTVQGFGYPVPAALGSVQAGSQSSISNDRNVSQATCSENPFGQGSKVQRSPPTSARSAEIENEKLRIQLSNIEKTTLELMNEVKALKIENEKLKNALQAEETNEMEQGALEYHTDEEELRIETDWILKQKRKKRPAKKRKAESSPEIVAPNRTPKSGLLNQNQGSKPIQENQPTKIKEKAPPPINIIGITEYATIQSLMKSVTTKEYRVVSLNNNIWKINTTDIETYRALAAKLTEEGKEWYTYEDKNDRPIKVMARGLHPTCTKQDIIDDLKHKGLKIEDAANILKREKAVSDQGIKITKRGLPLFMLTFNSKEKVETIFNIRAILNMRVRIEALRKSTGLIPQCKKCQGFNHTQKYCKREPRCVKCSGKHLAQACNLTKNTPPKCVNCHGQHPANYRGCEVARELQNLRNKRRQYPLNRGMPSNKGLPKIPGKEPPQASATIGRKTYSQIVQQRETVSNKETDESPILEKILKNIEALNLRLLKQERSLDALNKRFNRQETVNEFTSIMY